MNALNHNLKVMRQSRPAKVFYTGCALAGFRHGYVSSRLDVKKRNRMVVDRVAWGSLYAGMFAVGHPFVAYYIVKYIEYRVRSNMYDHNFVYRDLFGALLDLPHGHL